MNSLFSFGWIKKRQSSLCLDILQCSLHYRLETEILAGLSCSSCWLHWSSTASQIQMENGSHSAALLIMYGTDRAARLWTTGGPSHVPVKPFGYVLGITHVSWWFTKYLYLALDLQDQKNVWPISFSRDGLSQLCPLSAWTVDIETRSYHKEMIPGCLFLSWVENYTSNLIVHI